MNLVLTNQNRSDSWAVNVELDFRTRQWQTDNASDFWRRVTPSRRGSFQLLENGSLWIWDRLDTQRQGRRNPVILWNAPAQAGDTARRRGQGLLFDPKEPHLKDLRLSWQVDRADGLRKQALDLCSRNLPASGYKEPPNCVEKAPRGASPVNASGERATGCGGFVGWYFQELKALGVAVPEDRVRVTFEWTPPGGVKKTDTQEIYFTGPTFGHREIARAVEKRRKTSIYREFKVGSGQRPKPGDVYVLLRSDRSVRHVGVIIDARGDVWCTADGGQAASGYAVGYSNKKFDARAGTLSGGKEGPGKLDGWIDLAALTGGDDTA